MNMSRWCSSTRTEGVSTTALPVPWLRCRSGWHTPSWANPLTVWSCGVEPLEYDSLTGRSTRGDRPKATRARGADVTRARRCSVGLNTPPQVLVRLLNRTDYKGAYVAVHGVLLRLQKRKCARR